jgi:hypothetical protein
MTRNVRTRLASVALSTRGQWAIAVVAVIALDLVVFRNYLLGRIIPPGTS